VLPAPLCAQATAYSAVCVMNCNIPALKGSELEKGALYNSFCCLESLRKELTA
jgi:hypothetical protein